MSAAERLPAPNRPPLPASPPSIALVGCPNCGKTALFNALTGSRQKVANYAGVTVERKEGRLNTPAGNRVRLIDLPGTYSLRATSPDEAVTRDVLLGQRRDEPAPDALVVVADASNLRATLRLVLELKAIGRPMILALNMIDIARRQGVEVDIARLEAELGLPVVSSVAVRRNGTADLLTRIDALVDAAADATAKRLATQEGGPPPWAAASNAEVRAQHREVERLLKICAFRPGDSSVTARIDRVLLHPVAGVLILLAVLFLIFQAVFAWATPLMDATTAGFDLLSALVRAVLPPGLIRDLISDGIIAGVGNVLVFLPQIVILFLFIILLEDSGYMARAAFLMDRIMGGAGLHGRAFIPLLSSFACAIPGIMATRVIDNRRDRLTTILVAPLMTCSARIPVYTLIISAFVPARSVWGGAQLQGLVMFGLYAAGILSALAVALIMKRLFWRRETAPFLMELPSYKWPRPRNVLLGLWQRAYMFLRRAGTIILGIMILLWFLSTFPGAPEGALGPAIDYSIAGRIGHWLAPALAPIGFNWQITVALIPGLAAREVAVAALGTVYAVAAQGNATAGALGPLLAQNWSLPTALSLLAWYIFAPQCASTFGVVKRETNSWRWPVAMSLYMLALAYGAAFLTYRLSSLLLS